MRIEEYVKQAKQELDDMEKLFVDNYAKNPVDWSIDMPEEEWVEQEMAIRFA